MSEERRQVLEMLAAGKVTVEQANQLLEALEAAGRPSDTGELRAPARQRERPAQRARPRDAFFSNLTPDQLIEPRDHGVTPAFVREMRELGFTDLSPDDLVELRDHGVNAAFVQEMRDLGFDNLAPDELVELRDHGVNAAFVQEMRGV
jgi:hypothetical protein